MHATNAGRNGPLTAADAHTNQHFHHIQWSHQQNHPQGNKSDGYALPLVMQPRTGKPILILPETRKHELPIIGQNTTQRHTTKPCALSS